MLRKTSETQHLVILRGVTLDMGHDMSHVEACKKASLFGHSLHIRTKIPVRLSCLIRNYYLSLFSKTLKDFIQYIFS